jgi:hypothetical protein
MSSVRNPISLAAEAFRPDAILGYAVPDDDLRAGRSLVRGRDEIAAVLAANRPVEILVQVADGLDVLAEGRAGDASVAASLQLDEDGAIARGFWLASAAVDPSATWAGGPGDEGEARPVLDRYFAHLQAGAFADAGACFSEDCLYSHPPYRGCTERVNFRSRDELVHGWETLRGTAPGRQVITAIAQSGPDCMFEGVVDGIPNGGSFLASLSLGTDGLIRRYSAWYCAPRVERIPAGASSSSAGTAA